jgi:hypothetical protein
MIRLSDFPVSTAVISFLVLSLAVWLGASLQARRGQEELQETREDFDMVVAASLTLLGLIIGFSFSMATSRYDQRKDFEEAEANAIGTEYVRADVLPAADAQRTRELLRKYLDQRILFYTTRDRRQLAQINARSSELQEQLWSTVETAAVGQPNVLFGLAMSGMNDVLNSQGYTEAAWRNRIPRSAWFLMSVIALLCCAMMGYRFGKMHMRKIMSWILPFLIAISYFLIADIDSPRGGVARVVPDNLLILADSLQRQHAAAAQ